MLNKEQYCKDIYAVFCSGFSFNCCVMVVEYVLIPFPKQLNGKIEFNKKREEKTSQNRECRE